MNLKLSISKLDLALILLFLILSTGFLLYLPKSFKASLILEVNSEKTLPITIEDGVSRIARMFPQNPFTCKARSSSQILCKGSFSHDQVAQSALTKLKKAQQIGWVPRERLVKQMEDRLRGIEKIRAEISQLNEELTRASIEIKPSEEATNIRNEKRRTEESIQTYTQQLKLVEEGLEAAEKGPRHDLFEKKQINLKAKIVEQQETLEKLLPQYKEKASIFETLDQIDAKKQSLKSELDIKLLEATEWEEYLQTHKGEDPLPDPQDIQVSWVKNSAKIKIERYNLFNLFWLFPLVLFLFGLWRKLSHYMAWDEQFPAIVFQKKQSPSPNNLSPHDIESALDIPFLGELK